MAYDLNKLILDATKYKRNYDAVGDEYIISASMVAKEPLQNYLTLLYGGHDDEKITDSTLGTVFHRGMQEYINELITKDGDPKLYPEKAMSYGLPNGWVLSGTADLVVHYEDHSSSIHDYKLTKSYALKMIKKDLNTHDYTKQLQVLDLLHAKTYPKGIMNRCFIEVFIKDAKAIDKESTYTQVDAPIAIHDELMQEIITITDNLQNFIENGKIPDKCADVWNRKMKNGTTIATKCALYCAHGAAGVCPHYKPDTRESVARLGNW